MEEKKTGLPTLASTTIWMISLGYLGVQINRLYFGNITDESNLPNIGC